MFDLAEDQATPKGKGRNAHSAAHVASREKLEFFGRCRGGWYCPSFGNGFQLIVNHGLREAALRARPLPKGDHRRSTWVLHQPKIGRVDLCMSIEPAEIFINGGRVEESGKPMR